MLLYINISHLSFYYVLEFGAPYNTNFSGNYYLVNKYWLLTGELGNYPILDWSGSIRTETYFKHPPMREQLPGFWVSFFLNIKLCSGKID